MAPESIPPARKPSTVAESGYIPPQKTANKAGNVPEAVPGRRPETPRKSVFGSRKMKIGIAAAVLILLAIAFIAMSDPGILGTGTDNSTAPGLFGALSWENLPLQSLFSNQAAPVVTDTPLVTEGT